MQIRVDTHSHSIMSGHAYSSIKEMVAAASLNGLEALAITEHAPDMPGTCGEYYFQNYRVIPKEQQGVRVLMGAELNILDESGAVDLPADLIHRLDLVIASVHTPCYRGALTREAVTESYIRAMEQPDIHIIGHPDDARFPVDYKKLVQAAVETGTLLEVNNSSLSKNSFRIGAADNYMEMLRYCMEYGACVVLGSDAHVDIDVGNCKNSLPFLEQINFPEELVANTSFEKLNSFLTSL